RDERADLEQPGHAAAGKLLLGVGRVMRTALDDKAANTFRPGQRHVLWDVKEVTSVAREDDVLLVGGQARLRQVRRAQPGQVREPRQRSPRDRFEVAALGAGLLEEVACG